MAEQDAEQPEVIGKEAEQGAEADFQQVEAAETAQTETEEPGIQELEADLVVTIEQLQTDLIDANDRALRAQAEAQNTKRRAEQDIEKARKFALERFCNELLPVVDNLERALEAGSGGEEAVKPIAEGVELTLKSFLDVLKKFNLEPVDPEGEPFDPQLHQAMSMVENPDVEPNTVLSVMQKGYTLNGRLIRPAMVLVSKAVAS